MITGKNIRLKRIIHPDTGRTFILPLDHGISSGLSNGLEHLDKIIDALTSRALIDACVIHKGIVPTIIDQLRRRNVGLIVHLSGSTDLSPEPRDKHVVTSVEHAMRLGADAVSVHVNLGSPTESRMLEEMGAISEQCEYWGIPLLAMMYVRNGKPQLEFNGASLSHAARVAVELGADIIKINCPSRVEELQRITEVTPIPIVIAGGPKKNDTDDLFRVISRAISCGAAGVAMGRNIFQSPSYVDTAKKIWELVHGTSWLGKKEALNEKSLVVN